MHTDRHRILLLTLLFCAELCSGQTYFNVSYGPEDRQFVDIYTAPSSCPTPVVIYAHENGGTTALPTSIVDSLTNNGIAIVSWESLTSVNTPEQVMTGWADAQLMYGWVKANAGTYNFDTTNFIISGSSRGSILSWKLGHSPDPAIKGLYMYNALPDGIWADSTWWYPPNEVTVESPPIFFAYRYEPGVSFDNHDPNNGIIIMDTYTSLGIGDRDTLIHSLAYSYNTDRFQFLKDFALSLVDPCTTSSTPAIGSTLSGLTAYPNPFYHEVLIEGLQGGEQVFLRNALGQVLETALPHSAALSMGEQLPPGLYYLTVKTAFQENTFKVFKQ